MHDCGLVFTSFLSTSSTSFPGAFLRSILSSSSISLQLVYFLYSHSFSRQVHLIPWLFSVGILMVLNRRPQTQEVTPRFPSPRSSRLICSTAHFMFSIQMSSDTSVLAWLRPLHPGPPTSMSVYLLRLNS